MIINILHFDGFVFIIKVLRILSFTTDTIAIANAGFELRSRDRCLPACYVQVNSRQGFAKLHVD